MKVQRKKKLKKSIVLPTISNENFDNLYKLVSYTRKILDQEKKLAPFFAKMHPANVAAILQFLTHNERETAITNLGQNFDPQVLNYLDEGVCESILDQWAVHEIAHKLEQLEGQDAIKILEELNSEERKALLRVLKPEIRIFIEESFAYPEESAGRIMNHHVIAVPSGWNVEKTLIFLKNTNLPKDLEEIYIVNQNRKPIAKVSLSTLLNTAIDQTVKSISSKIETMFQPITAQKDIVFAFKRYSMRSLPIIDKKERLIGVIGITDIIDLIYSEAQEEFLHSGGIQESDFYDSVLQTSSARLKWLSFSIVGSMGVAILIDAFQAIIAKKTELVALMTLVMSISAISGIQVVTVNIRAIINRELNTLNALRTCLKEIAVAAVNGIILGAVLGLIFGFKQFDFKLGILLGASLITNMICGSIAGTLLPIVFNKFRIDPALSSGAFLASIIDALSAISFFMLAKYIFCM